MTITVPSYFISQGGVLDWRDRWGRTPIHWFVCNICVESQLELVVR
jgi:hypothetical protein